jgi:hypothetical protein
VTDLYNSYDPPNRGILIIYRNQTPDVEVIDKIFHYNEYALIRIMHSIREYAVKVNSASEFIIQNKSSFSTIRFRDVGVCIYLVL